MVLSYIYMRFGSTPMVSGVLYGIKPAVVAIVLFAAYRIGSRALKNKALWAIAFTSFLVITLFMLPFPLILGLAALSGYFGNYFAPKLFSDSSAHKGAGKSFGKAVIDDDTPTPVHAHFSWRGLIKFLAIGIVIWLAAIALLTTIYSWQAIYTQMAWFFTKAALLTFGGAYAVLPYVYQGAVTHYSWLTPTQMMDGLALGETTPGPLIMVVAFVGFVGGWSHAAFTSPLVAALLAASIVTFFTFLPSFIFIFMGAPFIESTKNNIRLNAPLTAITAAVVGVITALAVFFALHVFWPNHTQIDWLAILAGALGFVALYHFKVNTMRLIGVFAIFGLLHSWLL
jgi:chromate transporter